MKLMYFGLLFLLIGFACTEAKAQITINELMASNASYFMETDFYNFADWIELYNNSGSTVNLNNFFLSDEKSNLKKWQLPAVYLPDKAYYIAYCDNETGNQHTNFGLSTDGETVYLSNTAGEIIDQVKYPQQYPNVSYGRNPQSNNTWKYCAQPTMRKANLITDATEPSPPVNFSIPAGVLPQTSQLQLLGQNIKYTTNGAEPTQSSKSYSNLISLNKTTIVKAKAYHDGYLDGSTQANTYFFNEHEFTLPVISISFNNEYFYDDYIGIHVKGKNGIAGYCGGEANWYQDWERPAYFEYFDINGEKQISQAVGVKMSGGCTRGRDQKSISIYARSKYGDNDFDYPFFKQKPWIGSFKSLLLRNSGNDQDQTLLRDAYIQALVNQCVDIDFQSYQPTAVYFNGEYRGVMNLREKVDEDYFLTNYCINSSDVDFLERNMEVIRGSDHNYSAIISFVEQNDISIDENYEIVAQQIDIPEFINYWAIETYLGNTDWPQNNIKYWKTETDGKWRWILFDTDYSLGFRMDNPNLESFDRIFDDQFKEPWAVLLFKKLMDNQGFKDQFVNSFFTIMHSCFNPEWCNTVLDSLANVIDTEITFNQVKYGRTKNDWLRYIESLRGASSGRYTFMVPYATNYFNLKNDLVEVSVVNPSGYKGKVRVNQSIIQKYPVTISVNKTEALTISALPEKGYRFVHWEYENVQNTDTLLPAFSEVQNLYFNTGMNLAIQPIFEPIEPVSGIYLNEIAAESDNFTDDFNEKTGFIEIINATNSEVILNSCFLSDRKTYLERYAIPDGWVMNPGALQVFYADGQLPQGKLHLPFKLKKSGETIYLVQKIGQEFNILDSVNYPVLFEDYSFGKYENATGQWQHMLNPTPSKLNNPEKLSSRNQTSANNVLIKFYPNPTSGLLNIDYQKETKENISIDITDYKGNKVLPLVWLNANHNQIDVHHLENGVYIVRAFIGNEFIKAQRLMIMKN